MSKPVRSILLPSSNVRPMVADGLAALARSDRNLIEDGLRKEFADSLEIDRNLRTGADQENRWDYLLGHDASQMVVGLEPHSAHTGEVDTVIKKRRAALAQLRPHLKPHASIAAWFWVASGKVDLVPHEKQVNRLAQNGITFVGTRLKAKHISDASS